MKIFFKKSNLLKESELYRYPITIRVDEFTPKGAKEFASKMEAAHNTGQPVIPIVVDSYGGQVYSLMAMIAQIQNADKPVATIIEGKAMSCGAILSTFGEKGMRYMDPNATVMIHDVSSMGRGKVEEIKADAKETERLNKIVYEMMAKNCGKKKNYFLDLVHEKSHADWYLDANECLEHNIVQHLTLPKLEVTVDVNFNFGHKEE